MATNPIQKKTRNSFLLGMLVMFIIMGLVVALLAYMLLNMKKAENERLAKQKTVYVLGSAVSSGNSIDAGNLKKVNLDSTAVPQNAITLGDITEKTVAKIDISAGEVVTSAMVSEADDAVTDSLRLQEYNMLSIASQIQTGDFIDIRLRVPSGQDYIIVSKKKVEIPTIDGIDSVNTIWVKLTEDETILMSSAIVEAYQMEGALLYTTKYIEPGLQQTATPTYVPSASILNLITQNPNVVSEAKTAIYNRHQNDAAGIRNNIDSNLSSIDSTVRENNLNTKVSNEAQTTQTQRQAYLDALAGN